MTILHASTTAALLQLLTDMGLSPSRHAPGAENSHYEVCFSGEDLQFHYPHPEAALTLSLDEDRDWTVQVNVSGRPYSTQQDVNLVRLRLDAPSAFFAIEQAAAHFLKHHQPVTLKDDVVDCWTDDEEFETFVPTFIQWGGGDALKAFLDNQFGDEDGFGYTQTW